MNRKTIEIYETLFSIVLNSTIYLQKVDLMFDILVIREKEKISID
ncbi:MAG: hypothetical protein WKF91_07630 [Segetibacter sp.]